MTISVPASGERYYCVPLMDMYTNNFAIVGTRTSGAAARTFTVIGPNAKRTDPLAIRAPTNSAWILGRTLVDGDADLPKAHAFQDGWSIKGPAAGAPRSFAKRTAPWDQYFASVQSLMNESPPPMTDARMLDSMAPLIQFGKAFDSARYSLDQVDEIKAGVADAAVQLGTAKINVQDLLNFNPGDVLLLDQHPGDPMLCLVEGDAKFHGQPGVFKGNHACRVTKIVG